MSKETYTDKTNLITTGRPNERPAHAVSQPVERASTILFPTYEDFTAKNRPMFYGRFGTRTHRAFEESMAALENARDVFLTPSGLSAVTCAILSFARPGGHILVTDSAYDPTRLFCDRYLKDMQVETTYYDPRIGTNISELIKPNTQAILCESPGSLTFEVQDIPAIIAAARDVPVLVDNTWAASYYFKPLDHGAAVSIQAATKYIAGHSDCLLGTLAAKDPAISKALAHTVRRLGISASADDVTLAHRGLRTLAARLNFHEATGLALATWLEVQEDVHEVIHPALPSHRDHDLWRRDFTGASGLFAFKLKPCQESQLAAFCDAATLFGMGYSWGGYESLCIPTWPERDRTAVPWHSDGPVLRLHAGLEDANDLIKNLEEAFTAYQRSS